MGDEEEDGDKEDGDKDDGDKEEDKDEEEDGDKDDGNEEEDGDKEEDKDEEEDGDKEEDKDEEEEEEEEPGHNAVTNQEEFDYWVRHQDVPESDYFCNFDIRNHWNNGYFLWTGHNCEIYDLKLKLHFPQEAWLTRRTWTSSDMKYLSETCDDETQECEATFLITP